MASFNVGVKWHGITLYRRARGVKTWCSMGVGAKAVNEKSSDNIIWRQKLEIAERRPVTAASEKEVADCQY